MSRNEKNDWAYWCINSKCTNMQRGTSFRCVAMPKCGGCAKARSQIRLWADRRRVTTRWRDQVNPCANPPTKASMAQRHAKVSQSRISWGILAILVRDNTEQAHIKQQGLMARQKKRRHISQIIFAATGHATVVQSMHYSFVRLFFFKSTPHAQLRILIRIIHDSAWRIQHNVTRCVQQKEKKPFPFSRAGDEQITHWFRRICHSLCFCFIWQQALFTQKKHTHTHTMLFRWNKEIHLPVYARIMRRH